MSVLALYRAQTCYRHDVINNLSVNNLSYFLRSKASPLDRILICLIPKFLCLSRHGLRNHMKIFLDIQDVCL